MQSINVVKDDNVDYFPLLVIDLDWQELLPGASEHAAAIQYVEARQDQEQSSRFPLIIANLEGDLTGGHCLGEYCHLAQIGTATIK